MRSKRVLFQDLAQLGLPEFANAADKGQQLDHRLISDETFGRKSCIFVQFANLAQRRQMERVLEARGHKVHADYWPGSGKCQIQVSYFKGWHHDE